MVMIPRYDGPQIQEQGAPNARYSDAGAGNIGAAGQSIARGLGAAADVTMEKFEREKRRIDAATVLEARRKLSDWERSAFDDPNNPKAVSNIKGREAAGLYDTVVPEFQKTRSEIGGTLRSQEQRDAFDALAFQYEDRVKDRLTRHVAAEADAYAKTEFDSAIGLGMENIGIAVANNDPGRVASEMDAGLRTIRLRADLEGWPSEQVEMATRQFESKAHATAVQQMVTLGRHDEAEAYFTANADAMTLEDEARISPTMREIRADRIAQGFTAEINTGVANPDAVWGRMKEAESGDRQFDETGAPLTSSKGAVGSAQVMPDTAIETAKRHGIDWNEAKFKLDKGYNETIGRLYFGDMVKRYDGDTMLAAAAYNAGPGAVDGWLRDIGDPRKGDISHADFAERIPYKETRAYVAKTAMSGGGAVGGTYTEKMAAADRIADPGIRSAVKARVREQKQMVEAEKQDRSAGAIEAIERHLAGGGSMTTLPPDVRASAMAYAPKALLTYDGRTGAKQTDQKKYYDLLNMASDQPLKFQRLNLQTELPYLSDSDFQDLAKVQAGIKNGRGSEVAKQAKMIDAVSKPMLLAAGLMKKDGKTIVPRNDSTDLIARYYHEFGGLVREYRATNGKDPAFADMKVMADQLLMKNVREEPGSFLGIATTDKVSRFTFEELPADAIASLRVGRHTQFNNGQVWTLKGNKPTRIK